MSDLMTLLEQLAALRDKGLLTEDEFQTRKQQALDTHLGAAKPSAANPVSTP